MQTNYVIVSEAEQNKMEQWFQKTYSPAENGSIDISLLILYKISQLEERIGKLEEKTTTHWSN